jgi:hypothetical protein
MAFSDRFTGEDLVVTATPTGGSELDLSGDYTSFDYSLKFDNVDVTAGNEEDREMLPTKAGMTWSLKAFGGDADVWDDFKTVRTGVLVVRPQGTANGLPEFSFNYVLDGFDESTGTDKADELSISGTRSGSNILDFGSVQGAIRHLVFTTQPTNTSTTTRIADVVVSIEDPSNAVVTTEQSDIITITKTGASVASVVSLRHELLTVWRISLELS